MGSVWNLLAGVVLFVLFTIPASGEEKPVADIQVTGNDKIEASAILNQIETKVGNTLSTPILREDLKRIYKMGYFTDVQVDVKKTEAGPVVTFAVVEKPSIGQILISGNMKIETAKIREKVDVQLHSIVNTEKIQSGINEIEKLYKSKGYYGAKISYKIEPLEKNEVVLEIKIEEGKKGTIRKIVFKGNDHFSARTLRKKIQTQKRGIFSWITGKGYLDEDMLNNDVDLLTAFYYDEGYLRVKVEKPKVVVAKQGKRSARWIKGPHHIFG